MVTEQSITDVSGNQKRSVSAALGWELTDTPRRFAHQITYVQKCTH